MISSFIMLFEVGLIALLLLLVFRMLTLVRNDPFVPASMVTMVAGDHHSAQPPLPEAQQKRSVAAPQPTRSAPSDTCGLITQLHILLSLQDRDCREHGLVLETAPMRFGNTPSSGCMALPAPCVKNRNGIQMRCLI